MNTGTLHHSELRAVSAATSDLRQQSPVWAVMANRRWISAHRMTRNESQIFRIGLTRCGTRGRFYVSRSSDIESAGDT